MWSIHTKEYYSASKWREILTPATACVNLEDTMPREISQSKRTAVAVPPICAPKGAKSMDTEAGQWCQGLERGGNGKLLFNQHRVSVSPNERILEMMW